MPHAPEKRGSASKHERRAHQVGRRGNRGEGGALNLKSAHLLVLMYAAVRLNTRVIPFGQSARKDSPIRFRHRICPPEKKAIAPAACCASSYLAIKPSKFAVEYNYFMGGVDIHDQLRSYNSAGPPR